LWHRRHHGPERGAGRSALRSWGWRLAFLLALPLGLIGLSTDAANKSHPLRVVPVRLAGCEGVVPTAASRLACTEVIAMDLLSSGPGRYRVGAVV